MKKLLITLSLILGLTSFMSAFDKSEADKLLQKAEANTCFYKTDMKGDYQIVYSKPGEGRSEMNAVLYRRDDSNKWTILIKTPAKDAGKGYLQIDASIWFFDPAERRFTFTSAKDKFQNTNANTGDFTPQLYYQNYEITSFSEVTLGKYDCVLFELKAKTNNVTYPSLKLWVTKDDGLMRKREDYSLSGQKLRTIVVPSYQKVVSTMTSKEYYIPVNMVIQDNLKGKKINNKMEYERTVVTITNPVIEKMDDVIYSKSYLEMMSQE